MQKQKLKAALAIIFVLFVGSTYFLNQLLHQGNHTIAQNGTWSLLKLTDRLVLMGGQEFFEQRQPFAFNQLNLAEWHGHNEVTWSKAVGPWEELKFQLRLQPGAYVWLFISAMNQERYGLRISENAEFPSGFFTLDESARITEREPLNLKPSKSFNEVKVKISDEKVSFFLDNQLILEKELKLPPERSFSFRSGLKGVTIDNVELQTGANKSVENFAPQFEMNYVYFSTAVILILSFLIWLVSIFLIQKEKRVFFQITYQLLIFIFFLTASLIDRFVLAPSYLYKNRIPYGQVAASEAISKVELVRQNVFFKIAEFCHAKKPAPLPAIKDYMNFFQFSDQAGNISKLKSIDELKSHSKAQLEIVYMGTSQTWGAGALGPENSFAHVAVIELRKKLKRSISSLNFSVSGSWTEPLLNHYKKLLSIRKPEVLVVNLSMNDRSYMSSFEGNLRKVAELGRIHKIKTVFVLEAMDKEAYSASIQFMHQKMAQVGKAYDIPVFDLMGYVNSPEIYDSGIIWFDEVHMDRYGHQLIGRWLADKLAPVITGKKTRGE